MFLKPLKLVLSLGLLSTGFETGAYTLIVQNPFFTEIYGTTLPETLVKTFSPLDSVYIIHERPISFEPHATTLTINYDDKGQFVVLYNGFLIRQLLEPAISNAKLLLAKHVRPEMWYILHDRSKQSTALAYYIKQETSGQTIEINTEQQLKAWATKFNDPRGILVNIVSKVVHEESGTTLVYPEIVRTLQRWNSPKVLDIGFIPDNALCLCTDLNQWVEAITKQHDVVPKILLNTEVLVEYGSRLHIEAFDDIYGAK